ncbi:MAG: tetratricopeptide repeat protein [Chloroflexi bacterium]|nr:tetratricopeptide repeat protein [Chloroflexota bacterium]
MSVQNGSRKEKKPPKGVERIFERMKKQLEGKMMADEAISYRNLGEYEKAYKLLIESFEKYRYLPAITLIGTTALLKGDIDKAIEWFEVNIENPPEGSGYLLIEWYANLGLIFFQNKQDYSKARTIYEKALGIPKSSDIDDGLYNTMISGVHRDIAAVYMRCGQISLAADYARKRLAFDPDCEISKKVLAACLANKSKIQNIARLIDNPLCGTIVSSPDGTATAVNSRGRDFPSVAQRLAHTMGHRLLHMLYDVRGKALPQCREQCEKDIEYIEQWAGVVNGKWTYEQDERFACQYELFMAKKVPLMQLQPPQGEILDPGIGEIFTRISEK